MAKRIADKELTDRNWDQENEGEKVGTFSVAGADVLKIRPMKKAKRRNPEAEGGNAEAFRGFSLTPSTTEGGRAFAGLGNGSGFEPLPGLANGVSMASVAGFTSPATAKTTAGSLSFNDPASLPLTVDVTSRQSNGSAPSLAQSSDSDFSSGSSSREYSRQLTALNCSVRDWISKHVDHSPLCDLNPVFRDYQRHLASIERKYGCGSGCGTPLGAVPENTAGGGGFGAGAKADAHMLGTLETDSTPSVSLFSSQDSAGALFGGTLAPTLSFSGANSELRSMGAVSDRLSPPKEKEGAGQESEEPPVSVVSEVKEEDAFYSKKCKLFYRSGSEFKEKGVGMLHLKESGGGTQLLVRADTSLGNILLNILVPMSMPCSRTGRNNVMVVCVPNPPLDAKNPAAPVPLLIRLKEPEDADQLLRLLQKKE